MQNDKEKFKNEFKKRLYSWVLRLIKFIDSLPKDSVCRIIGDQLLRSGTSILAKTFSPLPLNPLTNQRFGWRY